MSSAVIHKLEVATKGGSRASMLEALDDVRAQVERGEVVALGLVYVTREGFVVARREHDSGDPKAWITLRGALAIAATHNT